jgi:hypothetical protein
MRLNTKHQTPQTTKQPNNQTTKQTNIHTYIHTYKQTNIQTSQSEIDPLNNSASLASPILHIMKTKIPKKSNRMPEVDGDEVRLSPVSIARHVRSFISLRTRKEEACTPRLPLEELHAIRENPERQGLLLEALLTKLGAMCTSCEVEGETIVHMPLGKDKGLVALDQSFVAQCLRVRNFDVNAACVSWIARIGLGRACRVFVLLLAPKLTLCPSLASSPDVETSDEVVQQFN